MIGWQWWLGLRAGGDEREQVIREMRRAEVEIDDIAFAARLSAPQVREILEQEKNDE